MSILFKMIYTFNAIIIKIMTGVFKELDNLFLKNILKSKTGCYKRIK